MPGRKSISDVFQHYIHDLLTPLDDPAEEGRRLLWMVLPAAVFVVVLLGGLAYAVLT